MNTDWGQPPELSRDPRLRRGLFESLDRATLQQRLLLCLYGQGTNTGLKRMAIGEHGASGGRAARLHAVDG